MSVSLEAIEETFSIFDADSDGKIARETVPDVLRALGKAPTEKEAAEIVKGCKEFVDLAAFKTLYRAQASLATPKKLEEDMLNCFRATDREGTGEIHEAELRQTLATLGEYLTNEQVDKLLRNVTVSGSGMIDYEKFVEMLLNEYPPLD